MFILWRALTKYNCTKCTTTTSTTQFLSLLQDKNNSSACNDVPLYLEWIWNWSFMDNNHIRQKIIGDWSKLQNDSFLMCWQFTTSLSHLYIKEWRLEEFYETQQHFESTEPLLKLFCIKSSIRISNQSSYLRNSKVLRVCIWFVLWTPLIVYQMFNLKHFS